MQTCFKNSKENVPLNKLLGTTMLNKKVKISKDNNTLERSTSHKDYYEQKNALEDVAVVGKIYNTVDSVKIIPSTSLTSEPNSFNKVDLYHKISNCIGPVSVMSEHSTPKETKKRSRKTILNISEISYLPMEEDRLEFNLRRSKRLKNTETQISNFVNSKNVTVANVKKISDLKSREPLRNSFQASDRNRATVITRKSKIITPISKKIERDATKILKPSETNKNVTLLGEKITILNKAEQQNTAVVNKIQQKSNDSTNKIYEDNLKIVLSNLYLNIANRLRLKFPLYCIQNFDFCRDNHYSNELPDIGFDGINCAFQGESYNTVIWILWNVCKQNVFPGVHYMMKIIDSILSLNPRNIETAYLVDVCTNFYEVFKYIVRTFPPCYIALREHYIKFINLSIDENKLKPEQQPILTKSKDIFNQLLDLLKYTMAQCSNDELSRQSYTYTSLGNICDDSFSEYKSDWMFEQIEARHQTFIALEPGLRLERIFMVLDLILTIVEHDLAMWLVHNFKTPSKLMFCEKNRPLIIEIFKIQKCHYTTSATAYFMDIYVNAVNNGLHHERLEILNRYLELLMEAYNSAEIETIGDYIKYPNVGSSTKCLIEYFYIKVKGAPGTKISTFLTIIKLLRNPFLRYTFIDLFLAEYSVHYKSIQTDKVLMQIYIALKYRIWEKHQRKTQLASSDLATVLSAEDLLNMLLLLFKSYNEFHGLETFMEVLVTDEVHCFATNNKQDMSMETYDLEYIEDNIDDLVKNFDEATPLSLNKIELSAHIFVNEDVRSGYYDEIKNITHIQRIVKKLLDSSLKSFDTTDWAEYIQKFSPPT